MNRTIVQRVVWKEYRLQRSFWLASLLLIASLQALVAGVAWFWGQTQWIDGLFGIALGAPALYALGCGATLLAGEHEAETYDFQRALPLDAGSLLIGKFGLGAVSIGLLVPPLWLAAWWLNNGRLPSSEQHAGLWLGGGVTMFELFAWGAFFSLLLRRAIWAVVAAALTAVLVGAAGFPMLYGAWRQSQFKMGFTLGDDYWEAIPFRLSLAAMISLLTIVWGRRWLDERSPEIGWLWSWFGRRTKPLDQRAMTGGIRGVALPLRFLIWQQWREARGLIAVVYAVFAAVCVLLAVTQPSIPNGYRDLLPIPFGIAPALAAVLGGLVFAMDKSQSRYRFFAERGVSGRLVWFSRQMVWGLALLAWSIPATIAVLFLSGGTGDGDIWWFALSLPLLFAVGQTCSQFFRSPVIAVFVSLFASLVAFLWLFLTFRAGMPVGLSVAPLPIALLWATWLNAPNWIIDRRTRRSRLRAMVSVAGPIAAVLSGAIAYRALEIPRRPFTPQVTAAHSTSATDGQSHARTAATMDEYRAVWQALPIGLRFRSSKSGPPDLGGGGVDATGAAAMSSGPEQPKPPTPEQQAAEAERLTAELAQRDRAVALFLQASRRERIAKGGSQDMTELRNLEAALAALIEDYSGEGRLDEAWAVAEGLLRLAGQFHDRGGDHDSLLGMAIEATTLQKLATWAAADSQTAPRIRAARTQLAKQLRESSPAWEAETAAFANWLRKLGAGQTQFEFTWDLDPNFAAQVETTMRFMPWERTRMVRLVDWLEAAELERLAAVQRRLDSPGFLDPQERIREADPRLSWSTLPAATTSADPPLNTAEGRQFQQWVSTTPTVRMFIWSQCLVLPSDFLARREAVCRGTLLQLDILAWRAEHGRLPESLAELTKSDLTWPPPLDPFTGQPFFYSPRGVVSETEAAATNPLDRLQPLPTTPFVWCGGERIGASSSAPREPTSDLSEHISRFTYLNRPTHVAPLKELLAAGIIFPIPVP